MWAWPRGKYHTSPGSKSLVSDCPFGWMTVVRTRPWSTSAHSAAVACQWSSRMPPGSSPMDTPEIPLEIGNCRAVASLAVLLPITRPFDFSRANLKVGNSLPETRGSGTLFMKLGSPASARRLPARAAVTPAANAAAPVRKFRRWKFDMGISLVGNARNRSPARRRSLSLIRSLRMNALQGEDHGRLDEREPEVFLESLPKRGDGLPGCGADLPQAFHRYPANQFV